MSLRVLLLGPPRVADGGVVQLLPRTRPAALLAYLACRDAWVTREELALLFRPESPDAEARVYLRKLIFRARSLPYGASLEIADERVRWLVRSDVVELRRAVASESWEAAACIDFDTLLDGFGIPGAPGFEAWLEVEREAVAARWRRAVVAHAAALERAGLGAQAVAWRERLLDREPLDEAVLQDMLRELERQGQRSRGLAAYETFARNLGREVGAEPSEVTQALADALRPTPAGVSTGPAQPPARLPHPATTFVGRGAELDLLVRELRLGGPRLVSIVGLGGVGKTRLAIEAARHFVEERLGTLAYVPLASSPPEASLRDSIASALGVASDAQRLRAELAERIDLLVLDDADRLAGATRGTEIAALLDDVPRLRVLITSRVPLGLAAEHTIPLAGMGAGDERQGLGGRDSEAVTLFVRRASRVAPTFVDDDETVRAVAAICRAVGGLPLAIELAASWLRTLSAEELLEAVHSDLDLLRTDAVDVPERQRSVRIVVDHAWHALLPEHRDALAKLTVFRSPWSLAAARAVAGADLDTMLALLSSNLVHRSGADRFEMHELVRRGAPHELGDDTRDAHARHVLGWVAAQTPALTGENQPEALAELHASFADVREAWHYAVRTGAIESVAASLEGLDQLIHARSMWSAGREAYEAALGAIEARDVAAAALRIRLLARLSNVERNAGDTETARRLLRAALAAGEAVEGRAALEARLELAKLDEAVHAYDAAAASYRAVLADARHGDDDIRSGALTGLANVLFAQGGEPREAMRHYEDGLAAARRSGDLDLVSIALINQGAGHYDLGQLAAAGRCWREAAELARRLGNRLREAATLNNLAALAESAGDFAGARDAYERSLVVRQEVGDRRGGARVLLNLGRLAQSQGDVDAADAYLEASVAAYEALDVPADLALALATRARIRVALGDVDTAERMTERALRLGRTSSDRTSMLVGLLGAATIDLHRANAEGARRLALAVADLAAGREEGVRSSALTLAREAERRSGVRSGDRSRADVATAATTLAAEVDRFLRRQ